MPTSQVLKWRDVKAVVFGAVLLALSLAASSSGAYPSRTAEPGTADLVVASFDASTQRRHLVVMNSDGTDRRAIPNVPWPMYSPTWAPDGKRVAFEAGTGGLAGLYVVNTDGTGLKRVTFGGGQASWSPDGKWIAFHDGHSIRIIRPNGNDSRVVADNGFDPDWSPDSRHLVYVSVSDGRRELHVVGIDGKGHKRLTKHPRTEGEHVVEEGGPVWSPDGRKIAYDVVHRTTCVAPQVPGGCAAGGRLNYDIFVINADGSGKRQLTFNPTFDWDPTWSPDSRRIAFVSFRGANPAGGIYTMDVDGTDMSALSIAGASPLAAVDSGPDWRGPARSTSK